MPKMKLTLLLLVTLFLSGAVSLPKVPLAHTPKPPNIVVIVADDVALMDFGIYGGEANTPNIDALAKRGAMFTQYRASPLCSPSRAMLLTGMDNHLTGVATIPEVLPDEQVGKPGYSMAFEPGVLTLADRLRADGYRTMMSGKWHLGEEPDEMPQAHGFDRSFALAASGADNWEDRSYIPFYKYAPWFENGIETDLPKDFYSSKFIVDKTLEYLADTDGAKPFFAYLPFQAIHIPVQAPDSFIANYRGRYNEGWEVLRKERHERAMELGLISKGAPMADLPPEYRPWHDLSENDQRLYAARMEVNAAMLEAMDFHIGRLIKELKSSGQYDNTIFVVTSDNGPEPSRGDDSFSLGAWHSLVGYDIGPENMGARGHWGFIGPEWAVAAATPGAWFKFYATEGGVRVPLIIAGPGIEHSKIGSPAMVTDIAPTLLEWIKAASDSGETKPMTGRSLYSVISGNAESAYEEGEVRAIEVSGNAALYKGNFKITRNLPPVGDGAWRLYDLSIDPGETNDLSKGHPEMLDDLLAEYDAYKKSVGVLDMPEGYNSADQIAANSMDRMLKNYPWLYLIFAVVLAVVGLLLWFISRRILRLVKG